MQNIDLLKNLNEKAPSEGQPQDAQDKIMTFEEKLKLAVTKHSGLFGEDVNSKIQLKFKEDNITGTTMNSINMFQVKSENVTTERNPTVKGKKIFRIKKYVKYNKFLAEICSDEEVSESDKLILKDPKSKNISPFSKVNFSKLKAEEKDERLKNLAKLVKRLRRKVKNLEYKVRFNATKLLNKYIWNKLGINTKNKYLKPEFEFDFEKICRVLKKIRNHDNFEYDDQKHLIENVINLVADEKLKLDSLSYKKICSILRTLIPKDRIKYISKKDSKIKISFPETEVFITNKEYSRLNKFKDNEEILRAVLGIYDSEKEQTVKVISEPPENVKMLENISGEEQENINRKSNLFTQENQNHMLNSKSSYMPFIQNPQLQQQTNNQNTGMLNFMGGIYQNPQQNGLFSNLNSNDNGPYNYVNNNNLSNNQNFQQFLLQSYQNYYQNSMMGGNSNNFNNFNNLNNMSNLSNMSNLFSGNNSSINFTNQFPQLNQLNQSNLNNNNNLNNNSSNSNSKPNNVFIK